MTTIKLNKLIFRHDFEWLSKIKQITMIHIKTAIMFKQTRSKNALFFCNPLRIQTTRQPAIGVCGVCLYKILPYLNLKYLMHKKVDIMFVVKNALQEVL